MDKQNELKICEELKNLYYSSESMLKTDAMVCRAYIDKVSINTIEEKVNAQMNAVQNGIYEINPKFKETSKNYEHIKELVTNTMLDYRNALVELSNFYDGKIEQLILRKVELESQLVGSYLNEEYLYRKINRRINQKEHDEVKISVGEKVKSVLEKITTIKKEKNQIDPNMIFKAMDGQDVINEVEIKNSKSLVNAENSKIENKQNIEKIEKEISLVNGEIERLNEQKKKLIYDAMEVGDKSISKIIRRPKVFKKITRFFSSRFNTAKLIETTIIDPLKLRIESFKNNELSNMAG